MKPINQEQNADHPLQQISRDGEQPGPSPDSHANHTVQTVIQDKNRPQQG